MWKRGTFTCTGLIQEYPPWAYMFKSVTHIFDSCRKEHLQIPADAYVLSPTGQVPFPAANELLIKNPVCIVKFKESTRLRLNLKNRWNAVGFSNVTCVCYNRYWKSPPQSIRAISTYYLYVCMSFLFTYQNCI